MAYVAVPAQQSLYQQSPFFHCRALLHKSDLEQEKKQFTADEKDIYIYLFLPVAAARAPCALRDLSLFSCQSGKK
jgi:hypothetical protein